MKIEHIGIIVNDLEKMKAFYESCFFGITTSLYINEEKNFKSYFIKFSDKSRLELMNYGTQNTLRGESNLGFHHISFELSLKKEVDALTSLIQQKGGRLLIGPRISGMGDYVSTVEDPEGNFIELMVLKENLS